MRMWYCLRLIRSVWDGRGAAGPRSPARGAAGLPRCCHGCGENQPHSEPILSRVEQEFADMLRKLGFAVALPVGRDDADVGAGTCGLARLSSRAGARCRHRRRLAGSGGRRCPCWRIRAAAARRRLSMSRRRGCIMRGPYDAPRYYAAPAPYYPPAYYNAWLLSVCEHRRPLPCGGAAFCVVVVRCRCWVVRRRSVAGIGFEPMTFRL